MKPIRMAVIVSDLHCGSTVGLAHPESEQSAGNIVGFGSNKHQAWLWENWNTMQQEVRHILWGDKAALFINGDCTEGCHHRTTEIIAATIEEHAKIGVQCLAPLVKTTAGPVYLTKGTECHTHGMEDLVAERLKAKTGKAKDKWLVEINGCPLDVAHHMGTTSRAYLEAGSMSIAMGNARMNYQRAGHRVPDVFLRGHRHCGGYYGDGSGIFGVTGGWQFLTRHGHKVVTDSIPRPSVIVLDWREKRKGELPMIHEITFNPPQDEIEKI